MSDDIKKFAELAGGQYPRGMYPNAIMFYPKELDRFVELIEKAQAVRIAELEALLKRADDIANWTGEDLICAGRSYASVVQAYKNDRAALKGGKKDE